MKNNFYEEYGDLIYGAVIGMGLILLGFIVEVARHFGMNEQISNLIYIIIAVWFAAWFATQRINKSIDEAWVRNNISTDRANDVIIWDKKFEAYKKISESFHYLTQYYYYLSEPDNMEFEINIEKNEAAFKEIFGGMTFGKWIISNEVIQILYKFDEYRLSESFVDAGKKSQTIDNFFEDFHKAATNDLDKYIPFKH